MKKNIFILLPLVFIFIASVNLDAFAGKPVISAGQEQVLTISESGTLSAWGSNMFGQLGVGEGTDAISIPVQVATDSVWLSVTSGYKHNIAIKNDGSIWGWGLNLFGQAGNGEVGDNTPKTSDDAVFLPVQITDTVWSKVSGGAWFSMGLKDDGSIWGWGYNLHGQLGTDTDGETKIGSPVRAGAENYWTFISAGHEQALAFKNDGTIWGWGFNGKGSLGDGTTDDKTVPTQISDETDWQELYAGYEHTLAIKKDGTLWVWGRNDYGQVGDGTAGGSGNNDKDRTSPTQIGSDTKWKMVRGGGMHSVAIKTDGTLWAWGRNDYGQLGDGTFKDRHTPKQIGTDTDWQLIEAGFFFTVAMKSNGEVWTWGSNNYGQLGDGTNTEKSNVPVKVQNLDLTDNHVPVADAGVDQTATEGDTVILDASGSTDSDGTVSSYFWIQTSGTEVVISDTTSSSLTFTAPHVSGQEEDIVFVAVVEDDEGFFDSDSVTATVSNLQSDSPDLIVKTIKNPRKTKIRKKVFFKAVVKNSGTDSAPSSKISFYLSSNNKKTANFLDNDILLGTKKVKKMSDGKSRKIKFKWKVPKKTSRGNYYVKAYCDSASSIDEADENNNVKVSGKKLKIIK